MAKKVDDIPNFSLDKKAWDEKRFGWVCTSAETITSWRTALSKLCQSNPSTCMFFRDEQAGVDGALKNVESLAK